MLAFIGLQRFSRFGIAAGNTDYGGGAYADIKVGDLVYCYNTETETVEQKEVTAVFVREIDHINYLTIEDENGNIQVIEVTDVHPFWVVTDDPDLERAARDFAGGMYHQNIEPTEHGFWVEAKDLPALPVPALQCQRKTQMTIILRTCRRTENIWNRRTDYCFLLL